jgi:EmrB/QacA subfamily drug resistance transporter
MAVKISEKKVVTIAIIASFVAFLDGAVINVALPAIRRDLGGGIAAQQWVVDGYLLTLGAFILLAGSLSDSLGRVRVLRYGLLGFGAASLLCAIAPDASFLIVARALQGVAGALLVPSSLALITEQVSKEHFGNAIGKWTAWTGMAFLIGPLLGGFFVDYSSWRLVFAINVIPITVTLYLLRPFIEHRKSELKHIDLLGAILCSLGLGGPVFSLIEQPKYGWSDPLIWITGLMGLAAFVAFIIREKVAHAPMLPLHLFARRNFSVGNAATLSIYAALTAATFIIITYNK